LLKILLLILLFCAAFGFEKNRKTIKKAKLWYEIIMGLYDYVSNNIQCQDFDIAVTCNHQISSVLSVFHPKILFFFVHTDKYSWFRPFFILDEIPWFLFDEQCKVSTVLGIANLDIFKAKSRDFRIEKCQYWKRPILGLRQSKYGAFVFLSDVFYKMSGPRCLVPSL